MTLKVLNDSEVLVVFKLSELSRSLSKEIVTIFQSSQLKPHSKV